MNPVTTLDFRRSVQVYRDYWRGNERTCRKVGNCVICGTSVHEFDDGENDPRGALGDHAASNLNPQDNDYPEAVGEIPLCFMHANEEWSYNAAMAIAAKRTRRLERRKAVTA